MELQITGRKSLTVVNFVRTEGENGGKVILDDA